MHQLDAGRRRPPAFYQGQADLIAIVNHHRREEEERWRASDRTHRIMVREITISRFLTTTLVLAYMIENFVL